MAKVNWGKLVLGGVIAAILFFLSDGFIHEKLLKADWQAVYDGLRATPPGHDPKALLYFGGFELGRGLISLFIYAMMRARMGGSAKTAAWAGVASWIAFSVTGPFQYIPLGFVSCALWMKVAAFQLVASVAGTIAGAATYSEKR